MRKLFVANLPNTINEDVLRQLFEATGASIVEVSLPRDHQTGLPKGFAFVSLTDDSDTQNAYDKLDGSFQGGRSIVVRPHVDQPHRKLPTELVSYKVVVRAENITQTEAMLRAADAGGVVRQWMGHNGYFWWTGASGQTMVELAHAIGGEPVRDGEAVKAALERVNQVPELPPAQESFTEMEPDL